MSKTCTVACDTAEGVLLCQLELPDAATVAVALAAARVVLGPVADWEHAPAGIFGRSCSREQLLLDGDRVELYRPLKAAPRERRQARAAKGGHDK